MDTTISARPAADELLERRLLVGRTRGNYRFILTRWRAWCHDHHYDPIVGVDPTAPAVQIQPSYGLHLGPPRAPA